MDVRFLTLAQQEVDEAVFWYNNQAEDKGRDFSTNWIVQSV